MAFFAYLQSWEDKFSPFSLVAKGENMWQNICPEIWFQMMIYTKRKMVHVLMWLSWRQKQERPKSVSWNLSDFNIYGKEFWDCVLQTKVPSIIFQLMKPFLYLVDYGGHELLYTERGQHSQQFLSYQLCHWGLLSLSIFFLRVKVKTC